MAAMAISMPMDTNTDHALPLLRLMHLVSPSLPVGGFAYSQGIEWAVEAGWIRNAVDLQDWLDDQLQQSLARLDLPLLLRLHAAAAEGDRAGLEHWSDWLMASRETAELRAEEANRGRALADLLVSLDISGAAEWKAALSRCQAAGFAFVSARWGISAAHTALGYAWNWLENLTLAAVKIIPLGQTQGQSVIHRLLPQVPAAVTAAARCADGDIGASSPALAIASSAHETQYTRLFRS